MCQSTSSRSCKSFIICSLRYLTRSNPSLLLGLTVISENKIAKHPSWLRSFERFLFRFSCFEIVDLITPYNVGSVLWRLFSTLEVVQYIGGITSVLWGDSFSTVEVVQHSGGIASVLWRLFSTVGG